MSSLPRKGFRKSQHMKGAKYIDLTYLKHRTKSEPILMMEMISIYLEQTPALISSMKQSLQDQDLEFVAQSGIN